MFSVISDSFGFIMKDFKTSDFIHRCDNVSDLYPIVQSHTPSLLATVCVVISLPTWHRRLGNSGTFVLKFLHSLHFITNSTDKLPICHAC